MNVKRVTLEGNITAVSFKEKCGKWQVKNFTEADIFVSFDENLTEENSIKIKSNYGQTIIDNEDFQWADDYKHDTIYIKGTGEVEVQQLCFH